MPHSRAVASTAPPDRTQPALQLRGLRKAYKHVAAVNDLELEVQAGECFGLLGPNGAGKTTTIEICLGLQQQDAGTVELLGRQWQESAAELRERIGVQLQETKLPEKLTVIETLRLFRSFYREGIDPEDALTLVQLGEKRHAATGSLSGGQRQRLALACAVIGNPEIVFLDEPTSGLDPQSRRQLWSLVRQLKSAGRTILLTTHYMDEAETLCDRVAIVDHGKVIALDSPGNLIASMSAHHVVEFATPAGRLNADFLRTVSGVKGVALGNSSWRVSVDDAHRAVPDLIQILGREGIPLTDFRMHAATLEDVFVSLTGRELRDA